LPGAARDGAGNWSRPHRGFAGAGVGALYTLQRLQGLLPLNPQHFPAVDAELALNSAVSFASNTSWQSYAGESTLGYLTQMAGITVRSFLSAAIGIGSGLPWCAALPAGSALQSAIFGWL
jgi:K+-transporting ATPase ATPase A chain